MKRICRWMNTPVPDDFSMLLCYIACVTPALLSPHWTEKSRSDEEGKTVTENKTGKDTDTGVETRQ